MVPTDLKYFEDKISSDIRNKSQREMRHSLSLLMEGLGDIPLGSVDVEKCSNLKTQIKYNGPIIAPIAKGDEIGMLIVSKDDQEIRSVKIYANEDIKKVNFLRIFIFSYFFLEY